MYRGQVVAVLPAEGTTREQLGLLMAGSGTDPGASGD
jgi:hypothetical protein